MHICQDELVVLAACADMFSTAWWWIVFNLRKAYDRVSTATKR